MGSASGTGVLLLVVVMVVGVFPPEVQSTEEPPGGWNMDGTRKTFQKLGIAGCNLHDAGNTCLVCLRL